MSITKGTGSRKWGAQGLAFKRKRTAMAWDYIGDHPTDFYKGTQSIQDACATMIRDDSVGGLILHLRNAGATGEPAWWPDFVAPFVDPMCERCGSECLGRDFPEMCPAGLDGDS